MRQIKDALEYVTPASAVIIVDLLFASLAPFYHQASTDTQLVGRLIDNLIKRLWKAMMISLQDIHLIAFRLGAHVAEFLCRWLIERYEHKVGRTGNEVTNMNLLT